MAGLGDIFGESGLGESFLLWNVGSTFAGAVLDPITTQINQALWGVATSAPGGFSRVLSPADLADMVQRNFVDQGSAASSAAQSGVSGEDFQLLIDNAGNPPGPVDLAKAVFKGIIPEGGTGASSTSFEQGIAEGRTKDKWGPTILAMVKEWPTTSDAVNAAVRGQLTMSAATALYEQVGGNPDYFQLLFNVRGNPPSPTELINLVRRGLIPADGLGPDVLSLQQGIAEGDTKDKWYPQYKNLLEYIPPPRTVTALERAGVMDAATAQSWYQKAGLSTDLAAAYSRNASVDKIAGTKLLAESLILQAYNNGVMSAPVATGYLNDLGYDDSEAGYILQVQDFQRETRALNSAISKVGTLYISHKITRASAVTALNDLGVEGGGQAKVLADWDIEANANVRQLTESQIAQAAYYGVVTAARAMQLLTDIGYSAYDAWVLISNTLGGPQGTPPPDSTPPPQVIP